jgi:hypothetical protein
VLSSFADPFRRTTKVELGCKLTYLSDLQEPVKWDAFDDPENAGYDADDQRIVTLPIHASSVMTECLTQLGITASSSPLTNEFSVAEFDFGAGYVQILSDLLVSESYFGYLDTNEVLQIISLDQEGGTGPVYTSADIVDLGPINTGPLPGEAVIVSYSTLKLKQPEVDTSPTTQETTEQVERLNWERQETFGTATVYPVNYKQNQTRYYTGSDSSITLTEYKTVRNSEGNLADVKAKETTIIYGPSIKGLTSLASAYLTNDIEFNNVTIQYAKTEIYFQYDSQGNPTSTTEYEYLNRATAFAGLELPYVINGVGLVFDFALILNNSTLITYETAGNYTKETITNYTWWPNTLAGQQGVGEAKETFASAAEVSAYLNSIETSADTRDGSGLVYEKQTIRTNFRGSTFQGRPSDAERVNALYAKDGDPNNGWRTESKAELELALGSATAQRRIEFEMRYPPDDIFSGPSGGPFTATPSDAPAKANRYGRVQNRLLLGNRSGVNLQLAPERLPVAPYSPLYLQADGLTALYRANGNQWAFDSNGIVCSTDALFWAAVGGTGTFWFPVAPGITTLPAEPAIVDGEMNATNVVLPYNETAIYESRLRLGNVVTKFDYALELLTEVPVLQVRTQAVVRRIRKVEVPAGAVTLAEQIPAVSSGSSAFVVASAITVNAPAPLVSGGVSVVIPLIDISLIASDVAYIGLQASVVQSPGSTTGLTVVAPAVSSGSSVAVPAVDVSLAAAAPTWDTNRPPTVVSIGTQAASAFDITLNLDSFLQNDIILVLVETSGDGTLAAPSGALGTWQAVPGTPVLDTPSTPASGSELYAWWIRAGSNSTGSDTVYIPDSGDHQVVRVVTIRGCRTTSDPWDVTTTTTKAVADATATAPAVTTTIASTLVLSVISRPNDSASTTSFGTPTNANLTGLTKLGEAGTSVGNGGGFVVSSGVKDTAGSTGTTTYSSAPNVTNAALTIAFRF